MRLQRTILILACMGWLVPVMAQEQGETPASPDSDPAAVEETSAEPDPTENEKKKRPFGLYVYASAGTADLKNPINSTIVTSASQRSDNFIDLDENEFARASIGWKLPNKKGEFRLDWNLFSETSYTARLDGRMAALPADLGLTSTGVLNNLPWWLITIDDGLMTVNRTPPFWSIELDANGNQSVDADEVVYGDADFSTTLNTQDDLQNRVQHIDMVYGREFGGRRYGARWWAGMRYSIYEGNIRAGAWLGATQPGESYTDGSFLRLLNFRQEYSGVGPTAALESNFNFFDRRVQLYLKGQVAFQVAELTTDSGELFTSVVTQTVGMDAPRETIPVAARFETSRDKSTWQTMAEVGARWKLRSGVEFDLSYQIQGYLDVVLLPSTIQIPNTPGEASNGSSAIYSSQDLVYKTTRFGVGFQF